MYATKLGNRVLMVLSENMAMIPQKAHLAGTINHWILGYPPTSCHVFDKSMCIIKFLAT